MENQSLGVGIKVLIYMCVARTCIVPEYAYNGEFFEIDGVTGVIQ